MKNRSRPKILSALLIVMLVVAAMPVPPAYAAACTFTATGTGALNWSTLTWNVVGNLCSAYPGQTFANDIVVLADNQQITLDVALGQNLASITFPYDNLNATTLGITGRTVTVTGAVTIPRTYSGAANTLNVGTGTLTASSIAFTNGGGRGRQRHQLTISSGTVTVTNITQLGSYGSATVTFTGAGTLNLGGTFLTNDTGTVTTFAGSTVVYNAAGNQTVGDFAYDNLTLSGSGNKTLPAGTSVTGNLSIRPSGTSTASVAAGQNLNVGSLSLGGVGQINGTWGAGPGNPPANQNTTYFATTTGYLTVANNTSPNNPPNAPSSINQYKTDATTAITQGGFTNQTQVVFKATAIDPELNQYKLEVEVASNASAFTNTVTCSSALVSSGSEASTGVCGAFTNGTGYKWQYRLTDSANASTAWTAFDGSDPNFTVDNTIPILVPVTPLNGATDIGIPATLSVNVTDPEGGDLTVQFYGRPRTNNAAPFSLVVLPDIQNYTTLLPLGPTILNSQTSWIVNNQATRNIVFVDQVGDLTNNGDNDTDDSEWIIADAAMDILDAGNVPYNVAVGNHDHIGGFTKFETWFGVSRFLGKPYYGGNLYGNANNYNLFSASGLDFILINLRCPAAPPYPEELSWANGLLSSNPDRRGIVVCHDLLAPSAGFPFSAAGQAVYDALKGNPNLFLMLGGHETPEAFRQDTFNGHTVYSIRSDYQNEPDGGNGWLRILEFSPATNTIQTSTYSPYLDQSWTDASNQFKVSYNMAPAWELIGTDNVAPGETASVNWNGLTNNTEYEWYAVASVAGKSATSAVWSFTTAPPANVPPTITGQNPLATNEETALNITLDDLTVTDPDNVYPTDFSLTVENGTNYTVAGTTITPALNFNGALTVPVRVNDGTDDSNMFNLSVTVNPTNDVPICGNLLVVTPEDTAVQSDPSCTDAEGNPLTFSIVAQPLNGIASVAAGKLVYTPAANYNGTDSFTYTANDTFVDGNVATVDVNVTAVNDAPTFTKGADQTVNEDAGAQTVNGWVTAINDGDPELTQTLTFNVTNNTNAGLFSVAPAINATTGNLTYTPAANANGSAAITITLSDNGSGTPPNVNTSASQTFVINVTAVNDAPVCNNVTINTNEDTTGTIAPNCTDLDGDTLTYSVVSAASNGTGSFAAPNLSYTPNSNYNGLDSFTYKANDGTLDSNIANVNVSINAVNNPPSFTKGANQTVNEDAGAQTVNGWATAIDDGDPELTQTLTFKITGNTNSGLFSTGPSIDATGNLTYTPAANANGNATITIVLSDNGGGTDISASQTFVITVNAVNDPPYFTSTEVISATQDLSYTYNIVTTDPDTGDTLVINASTLPAWLTFVDNGNRTATLSGTPTNSDVGSHNVVLRVSDGTAVPVEQAFTIIVNNVNDAPTFTSVPVTSAGESTPYTYNVVTDDLDAGDALVISATTLPAWLTLVDNHNRTATLRGTPNSVQVGVHNVVLAVTDGILTASQTFDITVSNSAPQVATIGITPLANTGNIVLAEAETISVGVTQLLVTFNQDVYNPTDNIDEHDEHDHIDAHDVTNPANYLLVRDNGDGFQIINCASGINALDTAITVNSVVYSNGGGSGPFVSIVNINSGLPLSNGNYRLYICGTTSIVDIVDNTLELAGDGINPGTDFIRNFIISIPNNGNIGNADESNKISSETNSTFSPAGLLIPVTGFAPNRTTLLPAQPADKTYKPLNEIRIEIPTLGINFPIVGVAASTNGWDLTWLKNSVGYLEGSAYPTHAGNTVLSAHVIDANNNLGPFSDIKGMQAGDKIYIHAFKQVFVYQVQENSKILPSAISDVFKHEEYSWVTLVTCEDYNAKTALYTYRRMVRAVLISVVPEK